MRKMNQKNNDECFDIKKEMMRFLEIIDIFYL